MIPRKIRRRPSTAIMVTLALLAACGGGGTPPADVVPPAQSVSSIQTASPPKWQETVLHSFGGPDGAGPVSNLIRGGKGTFFGTTLFGGIGAGTVFELTRSGSGYTEKVLYNFKGGLDGESPWGIVADAAGTLYGITFLGGSSGNGGNGWGTVFKLTPGGSGYTESVLYRFTGGMDAWEPLGPPVLDANGAIYGVSSFGGDRNDGAVFKLTPNKSGYIENVIYSFPGGSGGQLPQAGLTIDKHASIYGTTMYGGAPKDTAAAMVDAAPFSSLPAKALAIRRASFTRSMVPTAIFPLESLPPANARARSTARHIGEALKASAWSLS